ncbi:MAG: hypothetical protein IJG18_08435 [Kiritimatiellae bacterium]|nr:hypothetical protein [Kiritimatiellia bacterium]
MKTPTRRTAHRLAAVLAIATAFAATGAWAEDWTVSENTTLTADTTVDALTVEEGVTLDLNGYKLYCTSLAGSGTITSTSTDLTSPDTGGTHVTWITKFGKDGATAGGELRTTANADNNPRNLFNDFNGTDAPSSSDTSAAVTPKRILVETAFLPLAVTYDFGDGTPKKVNAYKMVAVRAGNSTKDYYKRCPKTWIFEGSNGNDEWKPLHSADNVSWQASGSSPKEFSFSNDTAYRYYRITFNASSATDFLEVNQLEYFGPGELHVNVPAVAEATVESLTISGNMKVVKDGEGRLNGVTGIGSNTFPGVLEVNAGTVYVDADFKLGTAADGTLTINGGTVEVNSSKATHIGASSGKTGTVNLNGGILKTKRLVNVNGGTGKVKFDGGMLQANNADNNGLFGINVTVTVNERGGTIDSGNFAVTVPAAISGTGAMRFKGGNTITHNAASAYTGGTAIELGTKIVTSNADAKAAIIDNLAIDGKTKMADENGIVVFEYSGLADEDVPTPDYKNCGLGTTIYRDGDTLKVDFVLPVWELAADTTWSDLVATYGAPAADVIVRIASSGGYTLTIDTDVDVKELVFNDGASATLTVAEGKTLTTENINGIGKIINNGTIVKTGTGTVDWPFDNASTGLYVISAGRINVSKRTGLAYAGSEQVIRVKNVATFDFHASKGKGLNFSVVLEDGARFANSDEDFNTSSQAKSLTLEGNATVVPFYNFGLIASGHGVTTLDLGTYTLTVDSARSFILDNTTISGTGTILVKKGTLWATQTESGGLDCTVSIGSEGKLNLGKNLTVKDFVNNGTISGSATLTVLGELAPGNQVPNLTLANGATVKATGTAQTVSTTFSASGTITVDASGITKEQLDAGNVAVLTVPSSFNTSSVKWNVSGEQIAGTRAKWRTDGTTQTLYLCKPIGLMVIFR